MWWLGLGYHRAMRIPRPRGALTEVLFDTLLTGAEVTPSPFRQAEGEDAALALWVLYELHHHGFDDVPEELEWDTDLLRLRAELERDLEARLRSRWPGAPSAAVFTEDLFDWVSEQDGPSLTAFVQRDADREQVLELLRVRSIYHLQEADSTSWVVPRLGVRSKAALMELQYDEYGAGNPNRLHHHLFARGMEASGLDPSYGAYIDEAPVEILEQNNAMSLFGLHRRLRGAALGHLAAFEATSSLPSRRMVQGLERLGFPAELVAYYAEHVEADAVHEQLAVRTICGGLIEETPDLEDDMWFGAFTCVDLEDRTARAMIERWDVRDRGAVA
jgi:Iron-containing redox enzyme